MLQQDKGKGKVVAGTSTASTSKVAATSTPTSSSKPTTAKKPRGRPKKNTTAPTVPSELAASVTAIANSLASSNLDLSCAVLILQLAILAGDMWECDRRLVIKIHDRKLKWEEAHPCADQTKNPWLPENLALRSLQVPDPLCVLQYDFSVACQIVSSASGLPDLSFLKGNGDAPANFATNNSA